MAITIVATAGASNANSLATEQQFIDRAATRLSVPAGTTVTGSTCSENEKKALILATELICNRRLKGYPTTSTQALALPRTYLPNPDVPYTTTELEAYHADDEIPIRFVWACIDLALKLLDREDDITEADPDRGVIRRKTDVLETEWEPGRRVTGWTQQYPEIMRMLAPYLDSAASSLQLSRA